MLFDARQFEQFFTEKALRRGLKLFERAETEQMERLPGFGYRFKSGEEVIEINKKGDKVISYACSCSNSFYCEHLSSVMFYFQQHALGLAEKKEKARQKKLVSGNPWISNFKDFLQQPGFSAEAAALLSQLKHFDEKDLRELFTDKSAITRFDLYSLKIRQLLKPFELLHKLDQLQTDNLREKLIALRKSLSARFSAKKHLYHFELALAGEFYRVVNLRFTGDESALMQLFTDAKASLVQYFNQALGADERLALRNATLRSVKTNVHLNSETFLFLIPYFLKLSKSRSVLEMMSTALEKRNYKIQFDSQPYNRLLVARLQVAVKEWTLFKRPFPFKTYAQETEFAIARAELDFVAGKIKKGFERLEAMYEVIPATRKKYRNDLGEYIMVKAREKNKPETELKFLKEGFIEGLHIPPKNLERFLSLLKPAERTKEIDELVLKIKSGHRYYSFEKLVTLYMDDKRYDELIEEIKKQSNKFALLHQLLLLKLPDHSEKHLNLYLKQLMEAYAERRIYHYQEQLFDVSKEYLDRLPEKIKTKAVHTILDQLGGQSKIHKYISELYRVAEGTD